ncbi:flagellar export chaperone FliS [Oceanospirillum maris]|jgi:flagellar protein FliS|uniref:flagellar export chaperone FliS n=1 Tax=Oceanospirillum maris TaxID=64977 RepID=UPI00040DD492|nr:flagellar export chaperone FliS [Oceanospirillum maris]
MNRAINKYKNVSVESGLEGASPYQVTKKLFDGCMIFIKQAKVAVANKDFEKKSFHISKAQAIITTLASSLQTDKNEEVGGNLLALYDFCLNRLIEASAEMNTEKLDIVEKIMGDIKSGWDSIPAAAIHQAEAMRNPDNGKVSTDAG